MWDVGIKPYADLWLLQVGFRAYLGQVWVGLELLEGGFVGWFRVCLGGFSSVWLV